jgi:hypothetical protein
MEAEADLDFSDREQSSALRATLRLILGAGVTPAQGGAEPTEGFAFNQVLFVDLFADAEVFEDGVEDVFVADFAGDRGERGRCGHYVDGDDFRRHH